MKTISIVIPVYNEQERLGKTFEALKKLQIPRGLKLEKVIFVDDGSTDETEFRIKKFIQNSSTIGGAPSGHPRGVLTAFKLITYKPNRGKGHAVKMGMAASESNYTLFCDADMSTPLSELEKFVHLMVKNTDVIIGTRKNGKSTVVRHQPLYREILGRGYTLLSNIVLNVWVTDFTCGFKAFSKEAKELIFPNLRIDHWDFDSESLFLAKSLGLNIKEVPVVWSDDKRSKVNLFLDLPKSFIELFLIRLYQLKHVYNLGQQFSKPAYSFLKNIKSYIF